MTNNTFIVVEDRSGDWWEGSLVDATRANQLAARGVCLLPVVPDLFRQSGVGGYHKRAWGAGWMLDTAIPRIVAPLTMLCSRELPVLNWCARLVPEASFIDKLKVSPDLLSGFIQIAADPGQVHAHKIGVTPAETIHMKSLTQDMLVDGSFYVKGTARAIPTADAHFGFGLYGMSPGLRVAWAAVSQSRE